MILILTINFPFGMVKFCALIIFYTEYILFNLFDFLERHVIDLNARN